MKLRGQLILQKKMMATCVNLKSGRYLLPKFEAPIRWHRQRAFERVQRSGTTDGYRGYTNVKAIEGIRLSYVGPMWEGSFFEIEINYPIEWLRDSWPCWQAFWDWTACKNYWGTEITSWGARKTTPGRNWSVAHQTWTPSPSWERFKKSDRLRS